MPLQRTVAYEGTIDLLKKIQALSASGKLATPEDIRAEVIKGANTLQVSLDRFVTVDPAMQSMKTRVASLYPRCEPVLITGPTGTGKELIARCFAHAGHPFVGENCAAIPEQLVESIFFGHKKGSFSGAHQDHVGLLEEAGEGVIFLDEIGDLPLHLQAKFLRAIQECEIRPVGAVKTVEINCRFIAATKYNLEDLVAQRRFREDLYARISTFELRITGLVDRPCDIGPITDSMIVTSPDNPLPPFPDWLVQRIYRYNVRAIEAAIARWRAYESYE